MATSMEIGDNKDTSDRVRRLKPKINMNSRNDNLANFTEGLLATHEYGSNFPLSSTFKSTVRANTIGKQNQTSKHSVHSSRRYTDKNLKMNTGFETQEKLSNLHPMEMVKEMTSYDLELLSPLSLSYGNDDFELLSPLPSIDPPIKSESVVDMDAESDPLAPVEFQLPNLDIIKKEKESMQISEISDTSITEQSVVNANISSSLEKTDPIHTDKTDPGDHSNKPSQITSNTTKSSNSSRKRKSERGDSKHHKSKKVKATSSTSTTTPVLAPTPVETFPAENEISQSQNKDEKKAIVTVNQTSSEILDKDSERKSESKESSPKRSSKSSSRRESRSKSSSSKKSESSSSRKRRDRDERSSRRSSSRRNSVTKDDSKSSSSKRSRSRDSRKDRSSSRDKHSKSKDQDKDRDREHRSRRRRSDSSKSSSKSSGRRDRSSSSSSREVEESRSDKKERGRGKEERRSEEKKDRSTGKEREIEKEKEKDLEKEKEIDKTGMKTPVDSKEIIGGPPKSTKFKNEATSLKRVADNTVKGKDKIRALDLYLEAGLKFLECCRELENEAGGEHGALRGAQSMYTSTGKFLENCANICLDQKEKSRAALCLQCAAVAYLKGFNLQRDQLKAQRKSLHGQLSTMASTMSASPPSPTPLLSPSGITKTTNPAVPSPQGSQGSSMNTTLLTQQLKFLDGVEEMFKVFEIWERAEKYAEGVFSTLQFPVPICKLIEADSHSVVEYVRKAQDLLRKKDAK